MAKRPSILDGYVQEHALASQLHVTPRTLQRWKRQRIGPPVTMLGRVPLYRVEGVRDWLRAREMEMVRDRPRKRTA